MRIDFLGLGGIRADDGTRIGVSAKGLLLIAALIIDHSGTASREVLANLLYPEASDGPTAQSAFRQLLRRTRAAASEMCLSYDANEVWIGPAARESDLATLLLMTGIADAETMSRLAASNPFLLENTNVEESDLQLWLDARRTQVLEHIRKLVVTAAQGLPPAASTQALYALSKALPDDPVLAEALARSLMAQNRLVEATRIMDHFGELSAVGALVPSIRDMLLSPRLPAEAKAPQALPAAFRPYAAGIPRVVLMKPRKAEFAPVGRPVMHVVEGLIEDLGIELAASRELAVIASHTSWQISEGHPNAPSILASIEFVLHTRVRPTEAGPLVSFSLVRTGSQEVIWAEKQTIGSDAGTEAYKRSVQSLIAAIVGSVERSETSTFRRTGAPTAYRYYLMGRGHLRTLTLPDVRRARKLFRAAIETDPHFARAYSWTAHTLVLEWLMLTGKDPEALAAADKAARQALELDPHDGNGYRALARSALFKGQFDLSLEWFTLAEHYAPHFADVLADYADTLTHNSMADAAKEKIDVALLLNPIPPDTYLWIAAGADFFRHDFDGALAKLRRMANQEPAYRLMAASAAMLGDSVAALKYRHAAMSSDPTFEILTWIQRLPTKDKAHLELYVSALTKAGFR